MKIMLTPDSVIFLRVFFSISGGWLSLLGFELQTVTSGGGLSINLGLLSLTSLF